MARQIIFHKYQGTENGFLIYDIRKNGGEMNDGLLHMIRSRNFGLDLDGILVGPYLVDGSLEMKMFDRQGHEVSMKKESTDVPISYMDEWTKAPFCVMINRNKCDNYSVDRICEVTEQLQITTERGIFDGIYIRK